ncbi:hypothetical protein [Parabacteroides pacaensis]|uniref:hypothetical protein n=1 Tax=Parabacteroides pacaensis TaxID=2086575 RepID=UPI000D0E9FC3|nr:hypothetical protein [Parabacteroides pacaensis]
MKNKLTIFRLLFFFLYVLTGCTEPKVIYYCGNTENELFTLLKKEGFQLKTYRQPQDAISAARKDEIVLLLSDSYPQTPLAIDSLTFLSIKEKNLKLYLEYPESLPGIPIQKESYHGQLERGIITTHLPGTQLQKMDILGINDCYTRVAQIENPLLVLGRVAGFDKAEYGLEDTPVYPLLYQTDNMLIAFTKLSNFTTGRYAPANSWKELWQYILSTLTDTPDFHFTSPWPQEVHPKYIQSQPLPAQAKKEMVEAGLQWFFNGHFLVHPNWKELQLQKQGDGLQPVGAALPDTAATGDGTLGILEGHASTIYYNGTQDYRYWLRADVQGETAFALAAGSTLLHNPQYEKVAKNLMQYVLEDACFREGKRKEKGSAVYGLIGWSDTHPYVFYADDNARLVLGLIGASAFMKYDKWNQVITKNILANFQLSNINGFFGYGGRLEEAQILQNGRQYYTKRPELINPHPHFESWMWACYLWLYNRTGYKPLLEKAKKAIRLTMEAYPDQWKWTNGIQQERARMILPLAWLVRIEDTAQHREWLDTVVRKLLENQQECGAIREELGDSKSGTFGKARSNKEYGVGEAPLISHNGDPVADMLYTSNFAFFSLNEAAYATGNVEYKEAVNKLSDFLTRIQVQSEKYPHLNGAWFRAFDYNRWDYWASNADLGWGAWSTLTGWIQSWIIATQVLLENKSSFWDMTNKMEMKKYLNEAVK